MKTIKGMLMIGLLVMGMNSFAVYVQTHDNATQVHPSQGLAGDVIKVHAQDVAKYCAFDKQIVPIHQASDKKTTYYLCKYLGSKRKTLSKKQGS